MTPVTRLRIQMGCGEPLTSRWRISGRRGVPAAARPARSAKPVSEYARQEDRCKP